MDTTEASDGLTNKPSKHRKIGLILLVLLLVVAAGGLGYWQKQQTDKLNGRVETLQAENAKLTERVKELESPESTVAKWPVYTSTSGEFSVSYKPDWLLKTCEGNEATIYMAPDEESQALCGSEKGSPISVGSYKGDQRTVESQIKLYGSDIESKDITIDGVKGRVISYTNLGNEFVAKGTKQISYEFFTKGRTFIASYNQGPSDKNYQAEFELVAKSLKFSTN